MQLWHNAAYHHLVITLASDHVDIALLRWIKASKPTVSNLQLSLLKAPSALQRRVPHRDPSHRFRPVCGAVSSWCAVANHRKSRRSPCARYSQPPLCSSCLWERAVCSPPATPRPGLVRTSQQRVTRLRTAPVSSRPSRIGAAGEPVCRGTRSMG